MAATWWDLPGPASFLETIEQDLRGQQNVLLVLPRRVPEGFVEALRLRVARNDLWAWRLVAAPNGGPPLEVLRSMLCPGASLANARALAEEPHLGGFIVCVAAVDPPRVPAWLAFLREYQQAHRNCGALGPQLCLHLAAPDVPSPVREPGLGVRTYRDVADALDLRLFAAQLLRASPDRGRRRELRAELLVELAGADPDLARRLATWDWPQLLQPLRGLAAYAQERGWTLARSTATWEDGTADIVEGRSVAHSAVLALRGTRDELTRRLWRAELKVLFPFLEEERVRWIRHFQASLRPPFPTRTGRVDEPRDLELSHLLYLVRHHAPPATVARLETLVTMRNALAHSEPIAGDGLAVLD